MPWAWIDRLRTMVRGLSIRCDTVAEQLWDYLDGEIDDPRLRRRIEAHLEVCQRCLPEYDYRKAFLSLVHQHAEDPVPPGLRARVFRELLEVDAGERGGGPLHTP